MRGVHLALIAFTILIGLALRWIWREHATQDAGTYLLPWYQFARDHGLGALRDEFTNYTPFYSYLLLVAGKFDNYAAPLTLIKAISFLFEVGCAIIVAEMVWRTTKVVLRASVAFCAVWLAPTVLLNGAVWGQADSIWTFFVLLSVSLSIRNRNGVLPFAAGLAVKAQAVFLGPFALGMIVRRRQHWIWLAVLPAVYLAFAIPVLLAGRPIASVLGVYLSQAQTFHSLTMNAANIWVFSGQVPYQVGVPIGIAMAGLAGVALTYFIARTQRDSVEFTLLAACASLFLMPFLLPKMHDRYFYAFELASIALACINPLYLPFAVLAQITGVLAYLAFDPGITFGLPAAALCNIVLGFYLVSDLCGGTRSTSRPASAWLGLALASGVLLAYGIIDRSASSNTVVGQVLTVAFVGSAFWLLSENRRDGSVPAGMPASGRSTACP